MTNRKSSCHSCQNNFQAKKKSSSCSSFSTKSLDTRAEAKIQTIGLSADEREDLIKFYQDIYINREKVLLRADYKEMVEIALKLLGSVLPAEKKFTWKKVGAVHKAWFMAWSLCSMKAFAFSLPGHHLHSSFFDVQHWI